jgi:hypothetical protein
MATTSVPRRGWRGTRVARREGCVAQTLHAAAGELSVAGRVGSNAGVAGGEIEFRPRSEVLGQLSVAGGQVRLLATRLRRVVGGIETWSFDWGRGSAPERASTRAEVGTTGLVGAPLVLALLLTVIGIPLALLGAALYVVLLPVAYVSAAIALGDWALRAWRSDAAAQWDWRLAAAQVPVLLWQASRVPWLGVVLGSLALLAGLGALACSGAVGPVQPESVPFSIRGARRMLRIPNCRRVARRNA